MRTPGDGKRLPMRLGREGRRSLHLQSFRRSDHKNLAALGGAAIR